MNGGAYARRTVAGTPTVILADIRFQNAQRCLGTTEFLAVLRHNLNMVAFPLAHDPAATVDRAVWILVGKLTNLFNRSHTRFLFLFRRFV
ncbi:hypothetical protein D3C78_1639810 [compost metagenome]